MSLWTALRIVARILAPAELNQGEDDMLRREAASNEADRHMQHDHCTQDYPAGPPNSSSPSGGDN